MIGSHNDRSLEELKQRLKATAQAEKSQPLTSAELQRKAKLEALLELLKGGKNVPNRQLQRWLTEEEWQGLQHSWRVQQELREELKKKPDSIQEYEDMLRQAIFFDNRAEYYSGRGNMTAARSCRAKSQVHCERALERLEEIITADASMTLWFDRGIDFGAGSDVDATSPIRLPRVVTSRSLERSSNHMQWQSKNEVKLTAVEAALRALER